MSSFLGGKSHGAFGQPGFFLAGNRMTILAFEKEVSLKALRASVTQSALRGCVFVLKFGWRVCEMFRKLYPAALAFQQADIYSSSLLNSNIFIARCYRRKQL